MSEDKNERSAAAANPARPNRNKRTNCWKHLAGHGASAALLVAALALVWRCSEAEPTREAEVAPIVEPTAVVIEIDPRTAKVGDAVYAIPRDPDGNCPDSAPAMEISVVAEAGEQSGVTVRMVKETCEIVIDEIEAGPQP